MAAMKHLLIKQVEDQADQLRTILENYPDTYISAIFGTDYMLVACPHQAMCRALNAECMRIWSTESIRDDKHNQWLKVYFNPDPIKKL